MRNIQEPWMLAQAVEDSSTLSQLSSSWARNSFAEPSAVAKENQGVNKSTNRAKSPLNYSPHNYSNNSPHQLTPKQANGTPTRAHLLKVHMDECQNCPHLMASGTLLIMAFQHYCAGEATLSLERMAQLCTDIGLLPEALSFAQLRARFRASLSGSMASPPSPSSLGAALLDGLPASVGLGLDYGGMLRCLRSCAEAAYGTKRAAANKSMGWDGFIDSVTGAEGRGGRMPYRSSCRAS